MTPQEAAENMLGLSEEQSRLSDESTELEIEQNQYLFINRPDHKSDKSVETAWKITEKGVRQIRVENRLTQIKNDLSVIKNFLRHSENVARNLY